MNYLLLFKTFLILNIFSNSIVTTTEIKGNLPDPLTLYNIFNQYVKPIFTSSLIENPNFRTKKNLDINGVIRAKIVELQEYLQDNDDKALRENNVLLEDKDDTTIIEFLPKMEATSSGNLTNKDDNLRNNLKKYKKLREKIDKALLKESVSDKTKQLVTKTLDDMIRKMLGSQCQWKTNMRTEKIREPYSIANRWNKGVHKIKNLLLNLLSNKNTRRDDISSAMDSIQILFNSVADDIDIISKKYKIKCEFIPKYTNVLRNKWDENDIEESRCANLVICSGELKEFMHSFYRALNDTATNVIRNYIEMYMRDVVANDQNEKRKTIKHLKKLADNLEVEVQEIFVTETQKLRLDKDKKTEENLKHLSHYVRHSIRNVKSVANNVIKTKLYTGIDKETSVIIDDIKVNMDIDLGNLDREFVTKICSMFHICNGKNKARRQNLENNKNNLYVQVQVSFDDDMVDLNSLRSIIQNGRNNTFNLSYFNVTRTTNIDNAPTINY